MPKRRGPRKFFTCPHCGADVPLGAAVCRECGSDAETGWSENAHVWSADIPTGYDEEDAFDYDEFVSREFPGHPPPRLDAKKLAVALVVALVCLGILLWTIGL